MFSVPGLTRGVRPQLFNRHQHRAAVSVRQGRPLPEELRQPLGLAQMDLQQKKSRVACPDFSFFIFFAVTDSAHLSKLPLPQLLPEDQLLPRELGGRDVLPGQGVHGEGGDGVHIAAGDALQPHDVRLGVVRRVVVEALVGGALGDVRLSVAPPTGWYKQRASGE